MFLSQVTLDMLDMRHSRTRLQIVGEKTRSVYLFHLQTCSQLRVHVWNFRSFCSC